MGRERSFHSFGTVVVALVLGLAVAVKGFPWDHVVNSLPGQPKVGFKQYAGNIYLEHESHKSLFYYFTEAQKDPHAKPLTLWLNGGPGCSSVGGGAFTELGPFYPNGDGRSLRLNSMSWNRASNLLFVESPVGVGWSYSDKNSDYIRNDASTAKDMLDFMLIWYLKFPSLKKVPLFLTGESYAGHYIPQLAEAMLDYNSRSTGFKFNIQGVALGNPLLNLNIDTRTQYEYWWSHGMISDETGLTIMNECDFDDYVISGDSNNVSQACNNATNDAYYAVGDYISHYDVILDVCYPSIAEQELRLKKLATNMSVGVDVCMNQEINFYLNLPEVQRALNANYSQLTYEWSMCSFFLNYDLTDANTNILPLLKRILQNDIPVWIYSGDQDSVVPLIGSRSMVRELAEELNFNVTIPYGAWFHKDQVGGWYTEYGHILTFATVRGASHMVPYSQPSRSLHLFTSFVHGTKLPTVPRMPIDYGWN